jgi:sterol 3beta-glucosyltransferase
VHQVLAAVGNPLVLARRFYKIVDPLIQQIVADCWRACQGAEALIVSTLGLFAGLPIAERLGVPLIRSAMHPDGPTRSSTNGYFPALPGWFPLRGQYNWVSHLLAEHAFWQVLWGPLNRAAHSVIGLPTRSRRELARRVWAERSPMLYAYSPLLAPRPPDWGPDQHVTGYWLLDPPPGWVPKRALLDFLGAGPPPVYVGFGSILAGPDPDGVTALLVGALERAGQRGILHCGWGDLGNIPLPPTVFKLVEDVPHPWLLPQVAAVVHHGGAGVTAATLCAGRAAVVIPALGDQFFWGQRLYELGVAVPPLPRPRLSVELLGEAIGSAVQDREIQERAAALGAALRAEQGVARGVALVQRYLGLS